MNPLWFERWFYGRKMLWRYCLPWALKNSYTLFKSQ